MINSLAEADEDPRENAVSQSVSIIHREQCDRLLDQEEGRLLRMTGALSGSEERLGVKTEVMT